MGTLDRDFVPPCPKHQPDIYKSQANPVSEQWYTVLDTTPNVRIIAFYAEITWAVTQPTLLAVRVTIDGNVITHKVTNPVSATSYFPRVLPAYDETAQALSTNDYYNTYRAFLYEGRSVKVEMSVTWATTQPTPLRVNFKYAKW